MYLVFGVFWAMLFLARKEFGLVGMMVCVVLGLGLLTGVFVLQGFWIYFVIGQLVLDVFLILKLFGGDIRIN